MSCASSPTDSTPVENCLSNATDVLRATNVLSATDVGLTLGNRGLLQSITFSMQTGEVVALVGPNGAGKSTLLKVLSGEWTPSQGSIRFQQLALSAWSRKALAQSLAVLPQKSSLTFPFTVREVVALGRIPHADGVMVSRAIVNEVIDYVQITALADRLYTTLSGGEQQQVQLARVLVQLWPAPEESRHKSSLAVQPQPQRLLLLDEPSAWLDLAHQQRLVDILRDLRRYHISTLLVVHDLNLALACADKVAVLSQGQLHAFGDPKDVLTPDIIEPVFGVSARLVTSSNHSVLSLLS